MRFLALKATLPGFTAPGKKAREGLTQHPAIDCGYDLCGVLATWEGKDGQGWSGWLPHLDLDVSRTLTAGSAEHAPFWKMIQSAGKLTLKTNLDLWSMLHPAIQPGSTLDYTPPPEEVRLLLEAPVPLTVHSSNGTWTQRPPAQGRRVYSTTTSPARNSPIGWLEILARRPRRGYPFSMPISPPTKMPATGRFPCDASSFPGVEQKPQTLEAVAQRDDPRLQGGNWASGQALFSSEKALCSRCHQVRGQGGLIGPDLSNLVHRDYDSVLRDIRLPSAALNPDYLSYVVNLKDGRVLTGTLRGEGDKLRVGTIEGKEITVSARDIDTLNVSALSTMPEGLDKKLTAEEMRDLLTFLLTEGLQPAPAGKGRSTYAPPHESRSGQDLAGCPAGAGPLEKYAWFWRPGPRDHGPGEHDYPLWQRRWLNLLLLAPDVQVTTAMGWPSPPTMGELARPHRFLFREPHLGRKQDQSDRCLSEARRRAGVHPLGGRGTQGRAAAG